MSQKYCGGKVAILEQHMYRLSEVLPSNHANILVETLEGKEHIGIHRLRTWIDSQSSKGKQQREPWQVFRRETANRYQTAETKQQERGCNREKDRLDPERGDQQKPRKQAPDHAPDCRPEEDGTGDRPDAPLGVPRMEQLDRERRQHPEEECGNKKEKERCDQRAGNLGRCNGECSEDRFCDQAHKSDCYPSRCDNPKEKIEARVLVSHLATNVVPATKCQERHAQNAREGINRIPEIGREHACGDHLNNEYTRSGEGHDTEEKNAFNGWLHGSIVSKNSSSVDVVFMYGKLRDVRNVQEAPSLPSGLSFLFVLRSVDTIQKNLQ